MNLLREREKTHGEFEGVANISQNLKLVLRELSGFDAMPWTHSEALDMICVKMARIICGDHNEIDHWTDIIGYAQLVLNHIKEVPGSEPQQEPPDEEDKPCILCGSTHSHRIFCSYR